MGLTRSPFLQTRRASGTGGDVQVVDSRFAPGNVFFVQSTATNAQDTVGSGQTPDNPFKSIAFAIGQCSADQGDVIVVLPGHVETITAAAGVNLNVNGVTILGLGDGRQRPQVNYTTSANASFDVNAPRCRVENLVFTPTGVASVSSAINVKAADFVLRACEIEHATATNQAVVCITTTAAGNRLLVDSCFFHGSNNAGTNQALAIVGGDAIRFVNNLVEGAYHATNGIINIATTATTNLEVVNNVFQNYTASNTKVVVDAVTGSTGQLANNRMQILSGTAPFTAATMSWVGGNYYANTIATAGTLI